MGSRLKVRHAIHQFGCEFLFFHYFFGLLNDFSKLADSLNCVTSSQLFLQSLRHQQSTSPNKQLGGFCHYSHSWSLVGCYHSDNFSSYHVSP